jgi:hypothetical protein
MLVLSNARPDPGTVGQALRVDRPAAGRIGQAIGHLQVAAVAFGEIHQAIDAAILGAAEQGRAVDLLMVVAGVAILDHGAAVATILQQVAGILGFHVDAAAKTAVAGLDRVQALFDLDVLDQLGFDEDGALLVALEAALGRTIDGHRHVFGIAQAPDVDGLATGLGRAAHVHPRQGRQHAGDIAWLVTVDLFLVEGRAPDAAGVDLLPVTDDAQGAKLDAVVGTGGIFTQANHEGVAHAYHVETAADQQSGDGRLGLEVALERRPGLCRAALRRTATAPWLVAPVGSASVPVAGRAGRRASAQHGRPGSWPGTGQAG